MKAPPFEKFIVYDSTTPNTFIVHVASPNWVREAIIKGEKPPTEIELSILSYRRNMFIEDAIREKLERAAGRDANNEPPNSKV
jgi:hypothetical protein